MEKEIIEGNKLIAEFMGLKTTLGYKNHLVLDDENINVEDMQFVAYHTDWNWLIPVVEKIELIKGVQFMIYQSGCEIYSFGKKVSDNNGSPKISAVYKAVIEFIKWYNEQKSPSPK